MGALAAVALTGCDRAERAPDAAAFNGIDITGAQYARTLALPDAFGKPRTLDEFKGKVLVVFFGYTQCPDVCPTTLLELATVKKALGADGARVQGLFVTLDPERDTAAVLQAYMANFDASFVALRGSVEQTQAVAKEFRVFYTKVAGADAASYSIDHTAGAYLFDAGGRVRVFSRHGSGAQALTNDLALLLGGR